MKMERHIFKMHSVMNVELPVANCPECETKFAVLGVFDEEPTKAATHLNYCYQCGTETVEYTHLKGKVNELAKT